MKKILILLFLFCCSNHRIMAQIMVGEPYHFCALNGSCYNDNDRRVTIEYNEYTPAEIVFQTELFQNTYPEFEIIEPTSIRYNCHGYAYSVFQGGENLWIQWEEDICNNNGSQYYSYVRIPENEATYGDIATIIDTTIDNYSPHSCIVYNDDTLISKFAYTPLFKHYKYDPWIVQETGLNSSSVYTYYRRVANTQIDGPNVFNGNATYTFTPNVTPSSCSWSVEPAEMFYQSSGSGNIANLSYKSTLSYLAPKAILTFTFAYTCDNHYTVKKEIDLTIPTTTLSGMIVSDGFVINEGATVMLTGEVRNNDNAKTVIKPGGSLVINGGVMTNSASDKKWQGIEVWGNDNEHQYIINGKRQQGYLELKNGATIENAVCAVELWNPGNYTSEGGVIHADNAVFRNNAKAVHAINYTNFNPINGNEIPYNAYFRNCTFVIDYNYIGEELFYKHVDLDRVNGIKFTGCSFSADREVPQVTKWTSGIAAYNAGFMVDSYCNSNYLPCPEEDVVHSSFLGFTSGILSTNDGSTVRTFTVRDSEFRDNEKGIYAENTGYATIVDNDFVVGTNADCSFGIYMDGTTEFCIEENNFYGNEQINNDTYGILIRNSGANNNNIYKNRFHNLTCGNLSMGNNGKPIVASGSKQKGLVYLCNTNEGNINDICVIRDETAIANGIADYQGSYLEAAGNTFSASQYQFYNGGDDIINYCYYNNDPQQQPTNLKWHRVLTISTSNKNSCASHYGGDIRVSKNLEEINSLQNEYEISLAAFNELNNIYTSRIDGGNTQAEVLDINTATASDAMRLRSELLGLSPYLSQEVLTTASRRDDVFSSSVLFEILSANPDELKKDTLISYLENKNNPMPQYMTELLREMANGTTARTALESQMAKSEREYLLAAGDIVRSNLNSEESDNEELRLWLANMNDMDSDRLAVASYIQEGDFVNAIALAETLPNVYGLQGKELEEHNDYMSLIRLYEILDESSRTILELTEYETAMIEEIAENGNGKSQMIAYSILTQNDVTIASRVTCPTLPSSNENSNRGSVSIQSNIAEAMGLNVNLAPNPTSAWSEVEYTLPADYSKAEIVITNTLGINVIKEELSGSCGRMTLNLEKLPSGVYTYFVRCGENVRTGKLIKK